MLVGVQLLLLGSYLPPVFKSPLNGKPPVPPHTIISVPVHTAVCELRASGTLMVPVLVQLFVPGLYLPPVSKGEKSRPPQMIISLPVHTAVCSSLGSGAVVEVAVQLSVLGLYLPPVFKASKNSSLNPAQTIISVPVQTAVWFSRASGTLLVLVAVQVFVFGLYLPPVFRLTKFKSSKPRPSSRCP